jgi:inner membrane protein
MDSLTQLALGAAVGEAVAGRQVGRRAALWGAVCGTLPDLDVIVPLGDAVRTFTYHRSASHSLFVLAALTPLMVWLICKLHAGTAPHRWRWAALVYAVFATHVLLDAFTVYGTQILWPIVTTPVAWSTIFIIDPLYTLPLLVGVIAALVASRNRRWGRKANAAGLVLSTCYLAWTVGAQWHVEQIARRALDARGLGGARVLSTPAPFNSVLWRVLAVDGEHYYEGFYSLLDGDAPLRLTRRPRRLDLIAPLADHWPVQRLQWFTRGFYAASLRERDVLITDLRMGMEPSYVFSFKVGAPGNPHALTVPVERAPAVRDWSRLRWVWERIFDPHAR